MTLEFELLTERTEQGKGVGQTRKVIIEPHDKWASIEEDMDKKGIIIDTSDN